MKVLLIWNGTMAGGGSNVLGELGGGDQVIIKCVNQGRLKPDMMLPASAAKLVPGAGALHRSAANFNGGLAGLILLLLLRTAQGVLHALRLRGSGYDLAVATSPFFFDLLPLLFSKARRRGAIVYHIPPKRKAVNLITRIRFFLAAMETRVSLQLIRCGCDFLIVGNDHVGRQFERICPGTPWRVLHAGIDTRKIAQFDAGPRKPRQACFLGRLTSQKGIFDLVEIMERIGKALPEFHLVMMGNGPERAALEERIAARGLRNITLRGFVTDEEKYATLKESAYFFFPSFEEGWGIALAEALCCGCKAVTYELPHYRDIFGEFPLYVPAGEKAAFAGAVLDGLDKVADSRQVEFVAQYDDRNVVAEFDAILGEAGRMARAKDKG